MGANIDVEIIRQIENEYQTVQQVFQSLSQLETLFRATKDNRGLFVIAYKNMTGRLQQAIEAQERGVDKFFHNLDWIRAYLLNFANLYREALYGSLQAANIPGAWRVAFEKAADDRGVISLQHLMLGINAHIGHDLPVTLYRTGLGSGEQRKQRQKDHNAVNKILKAATDTIQNKVTHYHLSQGFSILEKVIGPFDEWVTHFYFKQQRERAWYNGLHLTHLATGEIVDPFMKEWFVWALQSNQPISNLDRLLEQIDLRAYELAGNIIKWRLPKIPGFKGGEEELFDEFEQMLTDAELAQLTAQIERSTRVAESRDWTQIL